MTNSTFTFPEGDHIVRGTAADGMIRALAITAPSTVQAASDAHELNAVSTAALGRLMMAAQMMGWLLKGDGEQLSLAVRCTGDLGGMTVKADAHGNVRGFANNPAAEGCVDLDGAPVVESAIVQGNLVVVRTSPYIEPYVSQIALVNGTVNDDLTAYYILSEQIPTIVNLQVTFGEDGSVATAGGYFVQLMPGYEASLLEELQSALTKVPSVDRMLREGLSPAEMLQQSLGDLSFKPYESTPAAFSCDCSRERSERTLISLGAAELQSLIDEEQPVDIRCDFCNANYYFTLDELQELISSLQ